MYVFCINQSLVLWLLPDTASPHTQSGAAFSLVNLCSFWVCLLLYAVFTDVFSVFLSVKLVSPSALKFCFLCRIS